MVLFKKNKDADFSLSTPKKNPNRQKVGILLLIKMRRRIQFYDTDIQRSDLINWTGFLQWP